jgi:uncharacterized membrane protein YbaN (DUF454 family)
MAQPEFERADVDLGTASCRVEFGPRLRSSEALANAFTRAVREASVERPRTERLRDWWRGERWSSLTAFRGEDDGSVWETTEVNPGRVRLRHRGESVRRSQLARLANSLTEIDGVDACRAVLWSRAIVLDYQPESRLAEQLVDTVDDALRTLNEIERAELLAARSPGGDPWYAVVPAHGWRRIKYLMLAGGAFTLTLAALIVPGIPTVPCLLATGYYLARSSPRLNKRLMRSPILGSVLQEWEEHSGLSRASKAKLIALSGAIVAVTLLVSPISPTIVAVLVILFALSAYGMLRLPGIPAESSAGLPSRPVLRVLPAP